MPTSNVTAPPRPGGKKMYHNMDVKNGQRRGREEFYDMERNLMLNIISVQMPRSGSTKIKEEMWTWTGEVDMFSLPLFYFDQTIAAFLCQERQHPDSEFYPLLVPFFPTSNVPLLKM